MSQFGFEPDMPDSIDTTGLLKSILQWAVQLLGVEAGEIYLYEANQLSLRFAVATGWTEKHVGSMLLPGEGLAGKVFSSGEPMKVDDYAIWEGRALQYDPHPPFKSEIGVPLRWRDRIIGVLTIVSDPRQRILTQGDVQAAMLCANLAAVAIENARLYGELSASLTKLQRNLEQDIVEQTSELTRQVARIDGGLIDANSEPGLNIEEMLTRVVELRITKKVVAGLKRVSSEKPSLSDLTPRETEILVLIAKGHNNKWIASELSLAVSTVKAHVGSILSKLNVVDRTQAALWALRMGLVKPDGDI